MVHFVGAGSGAPDLITLRGKKFLEEADVVIYAGSLVNPQLLEYTKENCEIYSVSTDTHFTHKAWADHSETIGKIQFPMLGDPTWALSKDFGVLIKDAGQALRGTFIVNPEGEIVAYEVHDLGIGRNAEELLRKLQAAQFVAEHGDQVCPAKWKPGSKTLTPSLDLVGKL